MAPVFLQNDTCVSSKQEICHMNITLIINKNTDAVEGKSKLQLKHMF